MRFYALMLLAIIPVCAAAQAGGNSAPVRKDRGSIVTPDGDVVLTAPEAKAMASAAWLNEHPDVKHLLIGRKRLFAGDYESAIWNFDRAGYFGDKLAQAMLAEMYWDGKGTAVDRVKAYALADVAAERMNDPFLLGLRERYWDQLTTAERSAVAGIADEILARYSDAVTSAKLEQHWRSRKTYFATKGSGRINNAMMVFDHETGSQDTDIQPSAYYATKFWDVREYRTFKDKFTAAATRYGTVKVKFGGKTQSSRSSTEDKSFLDEIEIDDDGVDKDSSD